MEYRLIHERLRRRRFRIYTPKDDQYFLRRCFRRKPFCRCRHRETLCWFYQYTFVFWKIRGTPENTGSPYCWPINSSTRQLDVYLSPKGTPMYRFIATAPAPTSTKPLILNILAQLRQKTAILRLRPKFSITTSSEKVSFF